MRLMYDGTVYVQSNGCDVFFLPGTGDCKTRARTDTVTLMEEHGSTPSGKLTGIWQIVRLKEILQKWQAVTLTPKPDGSCSTSRLDHEAMAAPRVGSPQIVNGRLEQVNSCCDSDEESLHNPTAPPPDVPKGYLAVYVGEELRRFVIPTGYLRHSLFQVLLEKAEEEFGFNNRGGLTIPCEIETFKFLLKCIENQTGTEGNPDHAESSGNLEQPILHKRLFYLCNWNRL